MVTLDQPMSSADLSDTALVVLDDDGTVTAWTLAARRLTGHAPGEAVGRTAARLLPGVADRLPARDGRPDRARIRHRDGRLLDVTLRVSCLRGPHGAVRRLVSLVDPAAPPDGQPVGVVVRDRDLRCAWVSDTAERHDGVPAGERLGRRVSDTRPGPEADVLEAVMRQALHSTTTEVHEYRTGPIGTDHEHACAVAFQRLQDADGHALGVCAISTDVVRQRRARERLAVLDRAGTRLGSTLDVMQASQELADAAVPLLADYVAVDLEQSVSFGQGPPVRVGTTGGTLPGLRRAGLASVHRGVPESPWMRGELVQVPPVSPLAGVLRAGRARLEQIHDDAPEPWVGTVPALARRVREHGMHSIMAVPIRARRALLGVALFVRTHESEPFDDTDLLLAEHLVGRAAQSLDNARQYTRKHNAALALQRTLLPCRPEGGTAVDVASRYLPADVDHSVGGDWFDVIPLSGARVALVVGDVVGHGLHAAATMGRLRTAVRTLAGLELPPDDLLAHLDDTVQRLGEEDCDAPEQVPAVAGATCLYAVYDPATRRCVMASAGHPPPAVVDPEGRVGYLDLPTGAPLGVGLGDPYEAVEVELPEGGVLALYTDGLIDTRAHDLDEGMRRLATALTGPDRSLEELCDAATRILAGNEPYDDVTLLLARTRALGPDTEASWTLDGDPRAVRTARTLATRRLAEWGLHGLVDATELIVSELVTNAVRHGGGPVGLRLLRDKTLTVEVSDGGAALAPHPRLALTTDEGGRGLYLVAKVSRRWGVRPVPGGKVVWAELDYPRPARPTARALPAPAALGAA
ncbi:SpoIIE family protein phosphatase [Streptomyces pseudogriseolus]|uniref:SpoIIE family protein phosphatase n=1 Tax=Streptomyces pseudogriseolus TaxID=36817 RepID=UPI003FA27DDE|nr:SpoIIE family protein phosphatase [Streptomyces pseudogriseolus]